jgi:hypothetical protein
MFGRVFFQLFWGNDLLLHKKANLKPGAEKPRQGQAHQTSLNHIGDHT